tara:strand:+ start:182 stop:475 length:294 start_codon:yes stop_codon:yes gene_type:complete
MQNVRSEPIIQHLGMYYDYGENYGLDGEDHWYTAQVVLDYNNYSYRYLDDGSYEEQPTFNIMLLKLHSRNLTTEFKKYYTMDYEQQLYLKDFYGLEK